jgi:hypothetical protein
VPSVSPTSIEDFNPNRHYKSGEEYVHAIAEAMREEYRAIVDAGFLLQVDDPHLATFYVLHPELSTADVRRGAEIRVEPPLQTDLVWVCRAAPVEIGACGRELRPASADQHSAADRWPYQKLYPAVSMMQAAERGDCDVTAAAIRFTRQRRPKKSIA